MTASCAETHCGCAASADLPSAESGFQESRGRESCGQDSCGHESVTVDGVEIAEAEIRAEIQYHPARSLAGARAEAARALVVRHLLLREARRRNLLPESGDVPAPSATQEAIDALVAEAAPVPPVAESEIRAFFDTHGDRFVSPPLASASHILFAAPPDDAEARAHAHRDAEATLATLRAQPDRFESVAEKRSACPSARQRGSLGQVAPGDLLPEVERELAGMKVGELLAHPVETEHGYHLLRLDARAPGRPLPFEAVRAKIETYLRDRAWRLRVHGWVATLARQAHITGCDLGV